MPIDLQADCEQCAGLCCVGLAFDKGPMFAIDKAAGTPCPHLSDDCDCSIYDGLEEDGFAGCVAYDCMGAGQRVVQEVFEGESWRDDPALLEPMLDAFRILREVHEKLTLLRTARRLELTPELLREIQALNEVLIADDWTEESLTEWDRGPFRARFATFLTELRAVV